MLINRSIEQSATLQIHHPNYDGINRLLAAAVVSHHFCDVLLSDPARAIQEGFAGEHFALSADEYEQVIAIRSSSLADFAEQLCKASPNLYTPSEESISSYTCARSWPV